MSLDITRRSALARLAGAAALAPLINRGRHQLFAQSAQQHSTRAMDLVRESLVVDMLNQFLYRLDRTAKFKDWLKPGGFTETDYQAYKKSGVNVFNFGHAAPGADGFEAAVRLLAEWSSFIAGYPEWLMRISTAADFERTKQAGKLGILFGFQNANHFRTPDDVDVFYGLGQRVSQLTYNFRNMLGNGAFERVDGGVSELGVQIINRMNKAGMTVDVAHAGDRTQLDAFELSKKPVIISHGNARALNNGHPRCISDESIRAMAKSGGVMGINFISFMVKEREPVTVDDVVDHFDYVSKLVGIEHVGVGSDYGLESNNYLPPDQLSKFLTSADKRYRVHKVEAVVALQGPERMYVLTDALIRRGYSDANIRLILGGNFQRVLTETWASDERTLLLRDPALPFWTAPSPGQYRVRMETTKGEVILSVTRSLAPNGADRFYHLVKAGFYDDSRFFRVISGRFAQFGIPGDPSIARIWRNQTFPDDPLKAHNLRGSFAFAMTGPNARTTQIYINTGDQSRLDQMGFSPLGTVAQGMDVVDHLYSGYGETSGGGMRAGHQDKLFEEGNAYLDREFPLLDKLIRCELLPIE